MSVVVAVMCVLLLSSCSDASAPAVRAISGEVALVSRISAGWAGWCMAVVTDRSGECGDSPAKSGPVFAENWSAGDGVTEGAVLTASEVAEVSVNGSRPVPTRQLSGIASTRGLRSAIVEIPSKNLRGAGNGSFPHFMPLSAEGVVIRKPETPEIPLGVSIPTRSWQRPQHVPHGICEIGAENLPGLAARWGSVVVAVGGSYFGLLGRPFLSCASTEFFREEAPLEASVLLDATHPGSEPAPLPRMKAMPGHPGIFQAQGAAGEGQMLGRHVPHVWLVVEEAGSTLQQRLALLEHLRATIHL